MKFNPAVFERLLFPLNNRVYRQIQEALDTIEEKHPGKLREILANFEVSAHSDTQTETWMPGKAGDAAYPSVDVSILFQGSAELKISMLHKSTDYKIVFNYDEKPPSQYKGSHLVVGFYQKKVLNTFIIPLEYLLGFNLKSTLREGSYQLYSHTILSSDNQAVMNRQMKNSGKNNYQKSFQEAYQKNSLAYVGITKQTWQKRYRQHCLDMERGSNLRFHRALRGEFCQIGVIEHIVERAGLTEKQALEIEEGEVEKRSLHSLYPNGLNMIPGGYAGLKFVHNFSSRTGYKLKTDITADNLETVLADVQRHTLNAHLNSGISNRINGAIARLWAVDIYFRINATTKQRNRFSFEQIQAARIWYASGWPKEKILENLRKIDTKKVGMDQLEQLLAGKTYALIPDVLV
jgi:hypothetical protein